VLSIASNSHRHPLCQFAPTTSAPFVSRGSMVRPLGLSRAVFHMFKRLAESALFIGLMVLSIASNTHRHRSAKASAPFDFQGSVVGPPELAKVVFYMSGNLAESAVLIGSTVLSIDPNLHRHRSTNSHLHSPHPSILKEASSDPQGWPKCCSICLKASLKVLY
jgi:hypothetical protein